MRGTFLIFADPVLALWEESVLVEEIALPLPEGALAAVFRRYGKPLESGVQPALAPSLADEYDEPLLVPLLGGGQARLQRFQFMPYGWVHPADYLLWECPWPSRSTADAARPGVASDQEPLAAPAPLIASALSALARAAAG